MWPFSSKRNEDSKLDNPTWSRYVNDDLNKQLIETVKTADQHRDKEENGMLENLDDKIATDRDTRLATGLDLTGKKVFTDKGSVFDVFLKGYGIIMDYGANKYAYANFESAPYVYTDVLDCLSRHLIAYKAGGELIDPESGQLHLGHIIARCAIAVMKAKRSLHKDDPNVKRYIGWDAEEIDSLFKTFPSHFLSGTRYSRLKPKNLPYVLHMNMEMFEAVSESPFFEIRHKYTLNTWVKTFEALLIEYTMTCINGETEEDQLMHAKVLLWLAINIFYHDSLANNDHEGYYKITDGEE